MQYKNFNVDAIERTISILETYKGKYETTLLINCCMCLIVLPKERNINIPDINISNNDIGWGIKKEHICGNTNSYSLADVIRRIRNSIAHMDLNTLGEHDIEFIEFRDRCKFRAKVPIESLRVFALKLANTAVEYHKGSSESR